MTLFGESRELRDGPQLAEFSREFGMICRDGINLRNTPRPGLFRKLIHQLRQLFVAILDHEVIL